MRIVRKKIRENSIVFATGAAGYSLLEILWRGFTHWTMAIAGGLCFCIIYFLQDRCRKDCQFIKCCKGMLVITGVEFLIGYIVNIKLCWNVWDYSDRFAHIKGQICPLFMRLWFGLSFLIFPLAGFMKKIIRKR